MSTRRPSLESLEPRLCPATVTYHSGDGTVASDPGAILAHAELNNVYVTQTIAGMDPMAGVLTGDYARQLAVYGVGTGFLHTSTVIPGFGDNVDDFTRGGDGLTPFQRVIADDIQQGVLPPQDGNQLYVVFLAPGEVIENPQGQWSPNVFAGYHSAFTLDGKLVPYAVVLPQATVADTQYVYAHEFAETVTDAMPGKGWYADSAGTGGGEIADLFPWTFVTLDGFTVAQAAGPNGQPIIAGNGQQQPPRQPPTNPVEQQQDLFLLAVEEFQCLSFSVLAQQARAVAPEYAVVFQQLADGAAQALAANPMQGTPLAGWYVVWGEVLFVQAMQGGQQP